MIYNVVLALVFVYKISGTIQMHAIEQYFPVVLFIVLCKVALHFEFVDEILKCDHSNNILSDFPVALFAFQLSLRETWFELAS